MKVWRYSGGCHEVNSSKLYTARESAMDAAENCFNSSTVDVKKNFSWARTPLESDVYDLMYKGGRTGIQVWPQVI